MKPDVRTTMSAVCNPEGSATPENTRKCTGSKKVRDKARGSRVPLRAVNTAPQRGSGTFLRGSFFTPWGLFGGHKLKMFRRCKLFRGSKRGYWPICGRNEETAGSPHCTGSHQQSKPLANCTSVFKEEAREKSSSCVPSKVRKQSRWRLPSSKIASPIQREGNLVRTTENKNKVITLL